MSRQKSKSKLLIIFSVIYALAAYVLFFAIFTYFIAFIGNIEVRPSVNHGYAGEPITAIAIDLILIVLFGLQHSLMARDFFKHRIKKLIPDHLERSTYVHAANLFLFLLIWQWRDVPGFVWSFEQPLFDAFFWSLFAIGWLFALVGFLMINHLELLGLRQVWFWQQGKAFVRKPFRVEGLYRYIRHPVLLGVLTGLWSTPHMTIGHALLAGGMTVYAIIAIGYEERDLINAFGEDYERYRQQVPMLLPFRWRR